MYISVWHHSYVLYCVHFSMTSLTQVYFVYISMATFTYAETWNTERPIALFLLINISGLQLNTHEWKWGIFCFFSIHECLDLSTTGQTGQVKLWHPMLQVGLTCSAAGSTRLILGLRSLSCDPDMVGITLRKKRTSLMNASLHFPVCSDLNMLQRAAPFFGLSIEQNLYVFQSYK